MSGKTHKGIRKRFKKTASGKVLRWGTGLRHLLSHKSSRRTRRAGRWKELNPRERASLERQYGAF